MAAVITMGSIAILLSLIIIGAIFFQFASAFVNIVSPERGEALDLVLQYQEHQTIIPSSIVKSK
jgi:hypothetical protein